jgi:hypothetical protein
MSILISPTLANLDTAYYALANASSSPAGVTSVTAGAGIGVSSSTGAVTISNTGVLSISAGSNVVITGTSSAPIIAATMTAGTTQASFYGNGTLAYQTAVCPVGSQVPLATITLPSNATYVQAIWGANSFNGVAIPEIIATTSDATLPCWIYLSASTGIINTASNYSPFLSYPNTGVGESTVKLPSIIPLGNTGGALQPIVMSALTVSATNTWYVMLQNTSGNTSNVYINAATSTSQNISVLGYNSPSP